MPAWERNFRNQSVNVHQFSMVPRADIPRSVFDRQFTHKTTFDAGYLVPLYWDEVLPGDSFSCKFTGFCRMSTPLYPLMDNLKMSMHFFFIPNRLLWTNWRKFQGEQDNPADSISFSVPQMTSPASGYTIGSLHDYFGLPTVGQVTGGAFVKHMSLPLRAYNQVWHYWYRDENLQNAPTLDVGDGPDTYSNYVLLRRGKRKDYFTGALPWPQKGATPVSLPLGTSAPVVSTGAAPLFINGSTLPAHMTLQAGTNVFLADQPQVATTALAFGNTTGLSTDLSAATAATINQIRQAFQIQRLLERDARSGTRYVEALWARFGVRSPDYRLQRPEFLGGGEGNVSITPIAQQTQTGLTGGSTPLGSLAGVGTGMIQAGFTQGFTEHGIILGLLSVRADLTYQQGLNRAWSRLTRYDYYEPVFANLGEQTILNKEIYAIGSATGGVTAGDQDMNVFGYQERWAEYRYLPSMITSLFRSTAAGTLDAWHMAQKFTSLPTLNTTFIQDTPPLSRILAVGASANGQQFIMDSFFSIRSARAMPMFSVPGMIDHL